MTTSIPLLDPTTRYTVLQAAALSGVGPRRVRIEIEQGILLPGRPPRLSEADVLYLVAAEGLGFGLPRELRRSLRQAVAEAVRDGLASVRLGCWSAELTDLRAVPEVLLKSMSEGGTLACASASAAEWVDAFTQSSDARAAAARFEGVSELDVRLAAWCSSHRRRAGRRRAGGDSSVSRSSPPPPRTSP